MKKEEWLEFFRLVNDREPSVEEFAAAVKSGEITEMAAPTATMAPATAPVAPAAPVEPSAPDWQTYGTIDQQKYYGPVQSQVPIQPSFGDLQLMDGEKILMRDTFTASAIFRWMRTTVLVTNQRFISRGHRFLGVIPVSNFEFSYFQGALASLDVEKGLVDPFGFMIGIVFAFYSLFLLMAGGVWVLIALLLLAIGVVMALASFHGVIWARNFGGASSGAVCSLGEFAKLQKFYNDALPLIHEHVVEAHSKE